MVASRSEPRRDGWAALMGKKRADRDKRNAETEALNTLRSQEPRVDLFAAAELSLWAYSVLPKELWAMAERLKARFGDGFVYVGPHKGELNER